MRALRPGVSLGDLFRSLGGAVRRALMLDYDGTLAPFHVDPARAEPYPVFAKRFRPSCRRAIHAWWW